MWYRKSIGRLLKTFKKTLNNNVNEKDKEIERLLALNKELRNEMKVQKPVI